MAARRSRGSCVGIWRTGGFKLEKITFGLSAVLPKGVACPGQVLSKGNAYLGQVSKKV